MTSDRCLDGEHLRCWGRRSEGCTCGCHSDDRKAVKKLLRVPKPRPKPPAEPRGDKRRKPRKPLTTRRLPAGRPPAMSPETEEKVLRLVSEGLSDGQVALRLEGVSRYQVLYLRQRKGIAPNVPKTAG